MEYITLKNSDLKVSRLCIGGDPMGGHGWGEVSEIELIEAINFAVDSGINFFDTADVYGLGRAETILGKALEGRRHEAVIASKFSVRRNADNTATYYDNSPEWIRTAIHGSLKRLKTDYIDLYQLHYRDGKTPVEDIIGTLEDLKKEGLIRYFGLSNIYESDIKDFKPFEGKFCTFQDEYSLANREHEAEMQHISSSLSLTPMTWGSLGQGILTGKYDINCKFDENDRRSRAIYKNFHGEKLVKNIKIVNEIRKIAPEYGKSIASVAIRYILDYLEGSAVIVGVKNKKQVQMNAEALGWHLNGEQLEQLNAVSV